MSIKLKDFLFDNYDDYIYLFKSNGEHVTDMSIKFIPLWILVTYGDCDICVEMDNTKDAKFKIYKVHLKGCI